MTLLSNDNWYDSSKNSEYHYGAPYFTGHARLRGFGPIVSPIPPTAELIMVIPYVKEEVCEAINKKIGLSPLVPIVPIILMASNFGRYTYGHNSTVWDDASNTLEGQAMACFEGKDGVGGSAHVDRYVDTYFVYSLLIAR